MSVSRETERLADYAALVRKWNPRINLVAPASLEDLEARHIDDSLQLAYLTRTKKQEWLDIGSGGGFPGIVLAICCPDRRITLVDSDVRKCVFLRTVARELDLKNLTVLNGRVESIPPRKSPQLSARALAPLPRLLGYVRRHLAPEGEAWLMKGRNWQVEVSEARKYYQFDLEAIESRTDPDAAILHLTGLRDV